jgi:hypothetical protein
MSKKQTMHRRKENETPLNEPMTFLVAQTTSVLSARFFLWIPIFESITPYIAETAGKSICMRNIDENEGDFDAR